MKINATLYLQKPNIASLYYVIRQKDKKGSGWLHISIKELSKKLGLVESSCYRVIKEAKDLGWLKELELKRNKSVYIKYKSDKLILKDIYNIKSSLYIICSQKILGNKQLMKAQCYLGFHNFEQAIVESKLDYSIGRRKIKGNIIKLNQIKKEVNTIKSINKTSRPNNRPPAYLQNTSTTQAIRFSIKGERAVFSLSKSTDCIAAISSNYLSKKLHKNRRTVDRYLKFYNHQRVKLYKRASLIEATELPYVIWEVDEDRGICDAYKPLPFIYFKNVLHSVYRKQIKKPLISYINDEQLEVAKLCAITKGYSNDNEGAELYLNKVGLKRFKRNTNSLSDKPKMYNSYHLYKGQISNPAQVKL